MRARYVALFFISATLACVFPSATLASTDIIDDIADDTEWDASRSPYVVSFYLTIAPEATLTIDPGVVVQFGPGAGMDVLGRMIVQGTSDAPVTFTSTASSRWGKITFSNPYESSSLDNMIVQYAHSITDFYSKDLAISNTKFENGESGIEAYGSTLSLNNFYAENMSSDAIDVSYGSDVTMKNITLKNVDAGVEVYVDSTADIENLVVDHSKNEALSVYVGSSAHVIGSDITNVASSGGTVEVFGDSSLDITHLTLDGTGSPGDGIEIFEGGSLTLQDSIISNFSEYDYVYGIADYGSRGSPNSISLTNNEIKNNYIGVGLYSNNSTYDISNNSIHDNALYGLESYGTEDVLVSNNFWGDASGPYNDPDNLAGKGNGVMVWNAPDVVITFAPWLTYWGAQPISNVLFLPGIEGSRLYEGTGCGKKAEEKLWEPLGESFIKILRGAGDDKVKDLFLDSTGESVCSDVYAKPNDIIDSVGGSNIYKSLVDEMNGLKSDGTINDWKATAYDWRLSLTDLLNNGTERDGKIFYEESTSTPYIEQTLRALAGSSKSGKVTIIAHSNGGLVAKALMDSLGGETSNLVDKIILVGAPQSGAPVDVGALLYGHDQSISSWGIPILHSSVAQKLAENSPMAYHLLPSKDYFASVASDSKHPVARFAGDAYSKEISAYGSTISTIADLDSFLTASALNTSLIDYANSQHTALDAWKAPDGIEISQIAGWGADTVAGIDFYTIPASAGALASLAPVGAYRPIFTEDGDGTVPVPSALMMAEGDKVKRYWVDLSEYFKATKIKRTHSDLFEVPSLQDFIKDILNNNTDSLPAYVLSSQPPPNTENKKLTFFLHSPLTLQLTDSLDNVTGLGEDDSITQDIPGSIYGEFGDVKYITVPEDSSYQLTLHGQASGTFSLDIQETSGGVITASSTIASVPTTGNTLASLTISNGIDTASALTVDENGDGKNMIVVTPKVGETVSYEPLVPTPEPIIRSTRSGARSRVVLTPAIVSTPTVPSSTHSNDSAPQVITQPISTLTTTKPVQVKKKSPTSISVTLPKKTNTNIPQTASVYNAVSQQPFFTHLGTMIYNSLYGFWIFLLKFF